MADSLYTQTLPENRPDLEALIEAAITRLDDLDPDPDLEDGGDDEPDGDGEPQLGAPEAHTGSWAGLALEAYSDDRESDGADDEDGADREPNCGSVAAHADTSQVFWAQGNNDERDRKRRG